MSAPKASQDSRTYWAAEPNSERAAANAIERIKRYREWLKTTDRESRMRRGWSTMYGRSPDGSGDTSRTSASGDQGEYVETTLNNYATLVTQVTVRTTANKPGFKAIATNADSASMEQASFAQGLLEYYSNTHAIADRDWEMVEIGNITSEGWEIFGWDSTAGKNLTDFSDEGAVREGEVEVHATTPFRVAYDPDSESIDRLKWGAFKRRYNRFDLAKAAEERGNVELANKLRDFSEAKREEDDEDLDLKMKLETTTSDLIWVWELRHLHTPALPNGRLLRFVNAEMVLLDSLETLEDGSVKDHGYPYDPDQLHMHRYCPATVVGSIAGHAPSFDLLGLQELKDTVATQAATAANAGGITNLWTQTGDKPTVSSVAGAMNFLQSKVKPEVLKGVELSPQIPEFDRMLDQNMQARMGESDVSMGNVPKGMPGNLAALLEAKTVQYNSRGQASYAHVLERSRTGLLKLLKRFANSKRVAVLGGIAKGFEHKTWTAADLSGVDRFVVEAVSPLNQTYAGKCEAAKEMLANNLITKEEYLLVRETGRLEPTFEGPASMEMGIRKEKQMLTQGIGLAPIDVNASMEASATAGKPMPVFKDDGQPHIRPLIYDKHWLHIIEDLGAVASPAARDDGKISTAVMGVVEERVRLMGLVSPIMMAVLEYPERIQQAVMMAQNPMGMMPTSGTPPPKPGATDATQPPVEGLPDGSPPIAKPKPAKPPANPLTGEQAPSPVEALQ